MSDKIRKQLIKLIGETVPDSIIGTVKSVDSNQYTCVVDPIDESPEYYDVRLKATIDNTDAGLVSIPDVDSFVVISPLNGDLNTYYVTKFTIVTKWHIKVKGGAAIELDDQGNIKCNGGTLGGLPIIAQLKAELIRLQTAITTVKAAAGVAIGVFSTALDGGVSGSTYNTSVNAIPGQNLNGLENTKVKQ